jgi:hypothetical protein
VTGYGQDALIPGKGKCLSFSTGHNVGGNYFVRPDILMISSENHCSLVVACWNYHYNGGDKFITVWEYNTDKEL